ncbi:hypothetical protein FKG96_10085 [Olivibacter sp. LS-1]|uniref:hypothetical protein n=1 Tax=Olivibacter sp. LS-1 TaxID=2592345 RepID=UPI0011EB929B|nr:hypothetical protein [Olivibacter sp. LS-1]QEL01143.1 hypothetical protein FKG96_10085 [Olivibacter sp. LS-1]
MATPKLEVEIGANINKLVEALKEGQEQVKGFASSVAKSTNNISEELTSAVLRIDANVAKITNSLNEVVASSKQVGVSASNGVKPVGDEAEKAAPKVRRLKNETDNLNKSLRQTGVNGSGVAVEFNRIIQDAPYGLMGIGNNIQQLTSNFAQLKQQTGSTSAALKASFASLFSGVNLLSLGVSAVTSGFILYQLWSQRATKATNEHTNAIKAAKKELDEYIESLRLTDQYRVNAVASAGEEIAKLKVLYAVTQDHSKSLTERKAATDALQTLYPSYFKNLSDEAIMAGNAASAYERLIGQIQATARAMAAIKLSSNAAEEIFKIDLRQSKLQSQRIKQQKELNRLQAEMQASGIDVPLVTDEQAKNVEMLPGFLKNASSEAEKLQVRYVEAQAELAKINDTLRSDGLRRINLLGQQLKLEQLAKDETKNNVQWTGKIGEATDKNTKKAKEYRDVIAEALGTSADSVDASGLLGNDQEVERVRQKYAKLYADIDKYVADMQKRGIDITQKAENAKTILIAREGQEQANIAISEQKRIADFIAQIDAESGIRSSQSREKELAELKKWYDEKINLAQGNSEVIAHIEEGRKAQEQAINDKYEKKKADITLQYTRRLYETQSQILTRQLNERYKKMADQAKKEVKTQEEALARQKQLQEQYWQQLDAIRKIEQLEQLSISLGDAVGNAFETMLTDGTNVFQALANEFKKMIIQMVAQTAAIKVTNWIGGLLGIGKVLTGGGGLGSLLGGLIGGGSVMSASKAIPSAAPMAGLSKLASSSQSMNVNVTGEIRNNVISLSNKRGLSSVNKGGE